MMIFAEALVHPPPTCGLKHRLASRLLKAAHLQRACDGRSHFRPQSDLQASTSIQEEEEDMKRSELAASQLFFFFTVQLDNCTIIILQFQIN